jgi:hypothetical protein
MTASADLDIHLDGYRGKVPTSGSKALRLSHADSTLEKLQRQQAQTLRLINDGPLARLQRQQAQIAGLGSGSILQNFQRQQAQTLRLINDGPLARLQRQQAQIAGLGSGSILQNFQRQQAQTLRLINAVEGLPYTARMNDSAGIGSLLRDEQPGRMLDGIEFAPTADGQQAGEEDQRWDLLVEWWNAQSPRDRLEIENRLLFLLVCVDTFVANLHPNRALILVVDAATILVALHAVLAACVRKSR